MALRKITNIYTKIHSYQLISPQIGLELFNEKYMDGPLTESPTSHAIRVGLMLI